MEFTAINDMLIAAIEQVIAKDSHLLVHDLNERSISHRLAVYLTPMFDDFDVDCEYNGNVDAHNSRKYIHILSDRARDIRLLKNDTYEEELIYHAVFPDIIVHKRGRNGPE